MKNKNVPIRKILKKLIHYYWLFRAQFFKKSTLEFQDAVVVFFLPEAAIQSFINTMLVVALQLKNLGHKVIFIRCFSVLDRWV